MVFVWLAACGKSLSRPPLTEALRHLERSRAARPRGRADEARKDWGQPRRTRSRREIELLHRVGDALERTVTPDTAAWIVLGAMTAGEGLGFNRAFFLAAGQGTLKGSFGVGPRSPEEARQVWADLRQRDLRPLDRLSSPDPAVIATEKARHAATLTALNHVLGEDCGTWRHAFVARAGHPSPCVRHWIDVLQSRALLVVPLLVEDTPWGVVLADNFVTNAPIYLGTLAAAETLAHVLRAAVERTHLLASLREEQQQIGRAHV